MHGRYVESALSEQKFTMDARNVILSAGSVNSTEILLRSEIHGLKGSAALGTRFSGNGNFFGLAYNSDVATNVLGYGTLQMSRSESARASWQNSMATNCVQQAKPFAPRSASCLLTRAANSVRGKCWSS